MRTAQAAAIAHRSAPTMLPPVIVMVLEHFGRRGAAGHYASSIAGEDRSLHRLGEEALGSSDI